MRTETDSDGKKYVIDLSWKLWKTINFTNPLKIRRKQKFVINSMNPYWGGWIYDQRDFKRFVSSPYYDPAKIKGYMIRESSAIGMHGVYNNFFKGTIIPFVCRHDVPKIANGCSVHHLSNRIIHNGQDIQYPLLSKVLAPEICSNMHEKGSPPPQNWVRF